jgi:hypothetical protein
MQVRGPGAPPLEPVFILGLLRRSGTNYLQNLLCLHPACVRGGILHEDYLLNSSDLLLAYARLTASNWNPEWRVEEQIAPGVAENLGQALIRFLLSQLPAKSPPSDNPPARYFITKTPSVRNLENFFRLFPRAPLIVLVRDGRATVESGIQSFQWDFETAVREWAQAAQTVLALQADPSNEGKPFTVVRYEDVYERPEIELARLFTFLGLGSAHYDWERARHMPVSGSSETRRASGGDLHWKMVERSPAFDPTRRWAGWTRAQHERFNWLAGDPLAGLGYTPVRYDDRRVYWTAWNRLQDLKFKLARTPDFPAPQSTLG